MSGVTTLWQRPSYFQQVQQLLFMSCTEATLSQGPRAGRSQQAQGEVSSPKYLFTIPQTNQNQSKYSQKSKRKKKAVCVLPALAPTLSLLCPRPWRRPGRWQNPMPDSGLSCRDMKKSCRCQSSLICRAKDVKIAVC